MATSSKVQFNLKELQMKSLEVIEDKIQAAALKVSAHRDQKALEKLVKEWRERQEQKIAVLAGELAAGTMDNHRLSSFKLDPIPKADHWAERDERNYLEQLENKRSEMLAKSSALVPDENGNVSLTKTQLREFFNL